jgi:hypothetical protein
VIEHTGSSFRSDYYHALVVLPLTGVTAGPRPASGGRRPPPGRAAARAARAAGRRGGSAVAAAVTSRPAALLSGIIPGRPRHPVPGLTRPPPRADSGVVPRPPRRRSIRVITESSGPGRGPGRGRPLRSTTREIIPAQFKLYKARSHRDRDGPALKNKFSTFSEAAALPRRHPSPPR